MKELNIPNCILLIATDKTGTETTVLVPFGAEENKCCEEQCFNWDSTVPLRHVSMVFAGSIRSILGLAN